VRRFTVVVFAFVSALLIACAQASEACAHASLLKASPADGAVLPSPPRVLALTFNEPVVPLSVRLIGPDGGPAVLGNVVAEHATVSVPAPVTWSRGTYALSWRVISADGHPVGGTVLFSIGAPSAAPSADAPGNAQADASVRALLWAAKLVLYVGLFVGVGGAFFRSFIADPDMAAARSSIVPLLAGLMLAGLLAAAASVGLQGLDALARPVSALQQGAVWNAGFATSYARTALAAVVAMLAGLSSLAASSRALARGLALTGLIAVGSALALSGHASTAPPQLLSRAAVFLHGVCVAFWIGSLLPLYAGVRHSPRAGRELARFSRVIPIAIVLLAVTGLWLAVVQLGRLDALWSTSYGRVLACKLAAVAVLLGLAAANRYWLVPRFERVGKGAARAFAISLACELVLALAILGLVALWRFTPPPRALVTNAPIALHVHGEKAMAQIEISRGDGAHADVLVLDGAFAPLAVKEVTLVLANPGAGIEPLRRTATRAADVGANNWRIDNFQVPVAGRWNLRVELLVSDFDKLTIEDTVTLPRLP
jgi:copper transport protein